MGLTLDQKRALAMAAARQRAGAAQPAAFNPYSEGSAVKLTGGPGRREDRYDQSHVAQGLSGLNEGIGMMLGAPVDLTTAGINLALSGSNAVLGTDFKPIVDPAGGSAALNRTMSNVGAIKPETDDPGKQAIRRVAQDVGAAVVPVMGTAGFAARPAAMAAKELALATGSGLGAAAAEQIAPGNPWVELAGQLAGSGAVAGAIGAGKRLITPFPTPPERAAAAETLAREGVDLTAGQRTGSKGLQYAEAELGGGQAANFTDQQAEQFTTAALRRAGVSGTRATPEVMDEAFNSIGREFDDLASRSSLPLDYDLGRDLGDIVRDYREVVPESMRAPVIENFVADLINATNQTAVLPGATYQAFRSRLDRLARNAQRDPQLSEALFGIRNALDSAVERHLAQTDPDALGAWRQVRADYRNLLVLERAAHGGGEAAASGLISPARLSQAAQAVFGKRSFIRGQNDFAELAQAGQQLMTPLPQSGTAPRAAVQALKGALPFVGGALGGGGTLGAGAIAGAAAGAALPAVAGRAMLSRPGRAYLGNQILSGAPSGSNGIGPVAAALADRTSELPELTGGQDAVIRELMVRRPIEITVRGGARSQ